LSCAWPAFSSTLASDPCRAADWTSGAVCRPPAALSSPPVGVCGVIVRVARDASAKRDVALLAAAALVTSAIVRCRFPLLSTPGPAAPRADRLLPLANGTLPGLSMLRLRFAQAFRAPEATPPGDGGAPEAAPAPPVPADRTGALNTLATAGECPMCGGGLVLAPEKKAPGRATGRGVA
jgi:hypothetical protein